MTIGGFDVRTTEVETYVAMCFDASGIGLWWAMFLFVGGVEHQFGIA
jgi:hypothetical protein